MASANLQTSNAYFLFADENNDVRLSLHIEITGIKGKTAFFSFSFDMLILQNQTKIKSNSWWFNEFA